MPDALRLPVVEDLLDLFSQSALVFHAPLIQSDERLCRSQFNGSTACAHSSTAARSTLFQRTFGFCPSLPANKRQALLMRFEVDFVHIDLLVHKNQSPSTVLLDQTIHLSLQGSFKCTTL